MQKIGLPLALFIVLSTSVVFGEKDVTDGSIARGTGGLSNVPGSLVRGENVPLQMQGDSMILLSGREVLLNKQGFPQQVWIDSAGEKTALLAENVHFHFINQVDGKDFRLKNGEIKVTEKERRRIRWEATVVADVLLMDVKGEVSDKGRIALNVRVTALQDIDVKDIVMHIPLEKGIAKSMQGLGRSGGYAFDSIYHWKWTPENTTAEAWIGRGKVGLGSMLKGAGVWSNGGKGGIDVGIKGKSMLVNSYSGARHLAKGEAIDYNFNLIINETL